jgi:drug/metabolite transporter (DMT)-like permease
MSREKLGAALLLLSCIAIWGGHAVALKLAARPASGPAFDALFLSGLRFAVCAPLFALMLWRTRPELLRLSKKEIGLYTVFGFFSLFVGEALQALAVRYTSVANLTLVGNGTVSLFTALWAWVLFREPLGKLTLPGAALALIGVALIASHAPGGLQLGGQTWRGDALALLRSVIHGGYLLYLGRWLRERLALQVTLYNVGFGALWVLPYTLWRGVRFPWGEVTPTVWGALAWSIFPTTLFGFVAWNSAVSKIGPVAATNAMYLLPPAASVAAWLLLGEPITLWHALGGALILGGIVLLRWESLRRSG